MQWHYHAGAGIHPTVTALLHTGSMAATHPSVTPETPIVPEVVTVRLPGRDYDIRLGGEVWRCQVRRADPPLFLLTPRR
ncbi:MAG TPA: hypothetical protein VNF50_08820 [Acidimicrobiales bacterium]|nr:hypothetical protein [Acidimicrobiales bacterium]